MDNQRLIIWGFFAIMAFLTWQTWMQDYGPAPAGTPPAAPTETAPDPDLDPGALPELSTDDSTLPSVESRPETQVEAQPAADESTVTVTTDVAEYTLSTRGGTIVGARMLEYPVAKDDPDRKIRLLADGGDDYAILRSWVRSSSNPDAAPGPDGGYETERDRYELGDDERLVVPLVWTGPDGVTVTKRYTFERGRYAVGLEHVVTNDGEADWRGDQVTQMVARSGPQERSMFDIDSYSFDGPLIYNGEKAEKIKHDELVDDGPINYTTDDGWYASIEHHFLAAIVPERGQTNIFQLRVDQGLMRASVIGAPVSIAPGASATFDRELFVGPKLQRQLDELHPKLKLSVDYGWLTILSQPMFWLLSWIYGFVGNWGWAIILVTVVIKLVFYKLTEASGRSMAKMREIQPRMKALQERYKDDRQALSQAMMDLYKREKINPAAGCLPILIQMPFFLAFYWVLVESVEMRQAPFALWITDLSVRDPYFILPLIMGAAMLVQQKLNPAPADPVQARVLQIMPVMFTVFFAFFPSGLVLYWVTNTLLSIAQQWQINRVVHEEAAARRRAKPKKKRAKTDKNDRNDKTDAG